MILKIRCGLILAWLLALSAQPTLTQAAGGTVVYLPLVTRSYNPLAGQRTVNAPYLNSADIAATRFAETAILWLGRVNRTDNYTDVRMAYNDTELFVHATTFDRLLWYDETPAVNELTQWDAVTLYLNTTGNNGGAPTTTAFRFDAQGTRDQNPRTSWQSAYRGNGAGWSPAALSFTTLSGWRGEDAGWNNLLDDKGWAMTFRIPFAQLGVSGRPADGTVWGLALAVHDRDDAAGTAIVAKTWPESADGNSVSSWSRLRFGLTNYTPPASTPGGTATVRHGLNGAVVKDAGVGGYTQCGASFDYWSQWGDTNEAAYNNPPTDFNVQNQSDVADYPCFSKIYLAFPLNQVPAGKVVRSATLTLHQMGNSGVSGPGQPPPASLIQVLTTGADWNPLTLTWNNAPLALENFSRTSVGVIEGCGSTIPWPCVPRNFDVSEPVARAYAQGAPLSLVLYSADSLYGTGKYFISSDTGEWNQTGRPTLVVNWGNP